MSRPRVGFSATITAGARESSRATTSFCWLPPLSAPARSAGPGATISESQNQLQPCGPSASCQSIRPPWTHGPSFPSPSTTFSVRLKRGDQALGGTVLRDESHRLSHLELAAERSDASGHGAEKLTLSVPFDRRDADNLARPNGQRPVPKRDAVPALPRHLQRVEPNQLSRRPGLGSPDRFSAGEGDARITTDHRMRQATRRSGPRPGR